VTRSDGRGGAGETIETARHQKQKEKDKRRDLCGGRSRENVDKRIHFWQKKEGAGYGAAEEKNIEGGSIGKKKNNTVPKREGDPSAPACEAGKQKGNKTRIPVKQDRATKMAREKTRRELLVLREKRFQRKTKLKPAVASKENIQPAV